MRWDDFDEMHWEGHTDALDTAGAEECILVGASISTYARFDRRHRTT